MDEFIESLIKSKGYNEELGTALKEIVPAMVSYYGSEYEMLICEALANSYIYICKNEENIYDVVCKYDDKENNNNNNNNNDDHMVNEGDFKRASGVHISSPIINYKDGIYKLESVTNVVGLANGIDFSTDYGKSTLIHELGHLIKGYKNSYVIDGNILITRSGLIEEVMKLSTSEDGSVFMTTISEKNVGLEEGINSYDETNILSVINGKKEEYNSYRLESIVIEKLLEKTGLRNELVYSQLTGDTSVFINKYNEGSNKDLYNELSMILDQSVKATYDSLSNLSLYISDNEEDKKIVAKINERRTTALRSAFCNIEECATSKNSIGTK